MGLRRRPGAARTDSKSSRHQAPTASAGPAMNPGESSGPRARCLRAQRPRRLRMEKSSSTADTRVPSGSFQSAGGRQGTQGRCSGLAAAIAASAAAAALSPHEAGLLLQNAAAHHLGQLLRMGPRIGGHLHPGAGQPPQHLLGASALPNQLRVPPARPAQQAPAERGGGSG